MTKQRGKVLADELSFHLRGRILSGEYQPGEAIAETSIAAEYGVARPSARKALERLDFDGLLVRHAHAAFKVRRVDSSEVPELLRLLQFFEQSAVDRILDTDADLRTLRQTCVGSLPKFLHTLVSVSGSERLTQFHRQTTYAYILAPSTSAETSSKSALQGHSRDLVDALFRMDRVGAEEELSRLWDIRAQERAVPERLASLD